MRTLPPVVRDYIVQEKYTAVTKNLVAKYGLRIDQGSVIERELALLLMGIEDPTEFMQTLADKAKLDQATVSSIAQDVNEQIFVPLRAEEMKGGVPSSAPTGEEQPEEHFHLENKIAPSARPAIAPPAPQPRMPRSGGTLGDAVRSILPPPKPLESSTLLEDHEEPSPSLKAAEGAAYAEINKIPAVRPAPVPAAALPQAAAPQFVSARTSSMPLGEGAPANLPGLMPSVAPLPVPPPPAPAPAAPKPIAPAPVASYNADPYREPIDEPLSEM